MKCRTCARRLDLEKLDYTVGCKHEQMEGFVCLACAHEGVAYWMTNTSEDNYCEEYVERISNAFPMHECVEPTHECVEKQVTGKLINVEIPTKRESEEAEKQVEDNNSHIQELRKNVENLCGNCDRPSKEELGWLILSAMEKGYNLRPKGKWEEKEVFDGDRTIEQYQSARCSVCGKYHTTPYMYYFNNFNYCPNCGADMRGED